MTVPNGAAGINAAGWPAIVSAVGHSATSTGDKKHHDQAAVVEMFKEKFVGTAGSGISVFTSPTGPLAQALHGLPLEGQPIFVRIIAAIAGRILGVDPDTLVSGDTPLEKMLSVIHAIEQVPLIGDIVRIVEEVLTTVPSVARAIIRLITSVHIGALTDKAPNLVSDGGFDDIPTGADGRWFHSDTVGRTKPGSLGIVGNGQADAIVPPPVAVSPGQTFRVSAWVSGDSAAGDADSVRLTIVEFADDVVVNTHVVASLTPVGTFTWTELAGDYTVPDGVDMVAVAPDVTDGFTSGTVYFDDASSFGTSKIKQSWVDGLEDVIQAILDRWHLLIGTIVEALGGSGDGLDDLALALANIPARAIQGVLGAVGLDDDLQAIVNIIAKAFGHTGSGNASLGDLFNLAKVAHNAALMGRDALGILGVRNAEPVEGGLLATGASNYPFANANTWVAVAPGTAKGVTHRIGKDRSVGVVSWYGYGNVGITDARVIGLGIDATTGLRTVKHVSPNIAGNLPPGSTVADRGWVFYEIETADAIDQEQGDDWEYAVMFTGGTHHIWGLSYADAIVDHPYAQVKSFGFEHSWSTPPALGATITKAASVSSPDVLWIETAIETGNTASQHEPMWLYLGTEETSIAIPNWCARVIAVACGDGGGGHSGETVGWAGNGGEPGKFATAIWDRGVDFPATGTTLITLDPGTGGAGGVSPFSQNGKSGDGTTISIPGKSVTAEGGKGATGIRFVLVTGPPVGRGPDVFTFEGWEFEPGKDQNAYGGAGIDAGGGGNGGNWLTLSTGGRGGKGGGWVVFLPGDPVGAAPPPPPVVNVPPPPPIVSFAEATFSSITINLAPGVASESAMRVRSVGTPKLTPILAASSVSRTRSVGSPTVAPALPPPTYAAVGAGAIAFTVPSAFNFTAPVGADVFIAITIDRNRNIIGADIGGATNSTPIASVSHDNVTSYGTTKVYRFAAAGTGSPLAIQAHGTGTAWWVVQAIAISGVNTVGTPLTVTGNGTAISQTIPAGFGLQVVSTGAGGLNTSGLSGFTGVTNRSNITDTGTSLALNTSTAAASMTATNGAAYPWAAIYIPLT